MAIQDDFQVSSTGDIRHTAGTTNYTVIEFHRYLGALMDDAQAAGNDILDITDSTASERATDNLITLLAPYNIDQTASQFLYDGSIVQTGGAEIWDGIVVYSPAGTATEVIQAGAKVTNFWGTAYNADAAQGISHRFMIRVRTAGVDIDDRKLLGQTRTFGNTYAEFPINGTSRGNNVIALSTSADLNNATVAGTVATWSDIVNIEGYRSIDVDGNTTPENYYSEWNKASRSINQLYERSKWLTRAGSAEILYGLNGELFRGITHEVDLTTPRAGTFSAVESVTWGTGITAGTGKMLAINSPTAGTKMWIQLITGVPPSASVTITGTTSTATATNTGTPVARALSRPFIGASTGSAIIGGYGVGLQANTLTATDKLFDLTNTQRIPPNNVTFTVSGIVATEDRVLVGPESGGVLNEAQFTIVGTLTGAAVTSVVINTTVPTDTPLSGTIRILANSGIWKRVPYSSYTGSTFTIPSYDFSTDNVTSGNNCYISYIDTDAAAATASFTSVYLSDRALFIRVRDGKATPIKTFETTGTLGSAGGGATAIRTADA